jgi:hypothetical protein
MRFFRMVDSAPPRPPLMTPLQLTFEAGVEIRSLAVDQQACYILGKR